MSTLQNTGLVHENILIKIKYDITVFLHIGQRCFVTGWGRLSNTGPKPKILQEAQVPIVTAQECRRSYGNRITSRMLCAGYFQGGVDTCEGDSGGIRFIFGLCGRVTHQYYTCLQYAIQFLLYIFGTPLTKNTWRCEYK